ncbi:hypothetical protein [Ensifer sesbaniae]|uniref:hypothetical protein n=1 Tax=Ensifer sesbaniae TaxID=1214071 RepID=UPI001FE33E4E|nr:hypothetical protein [Ensifer sesbaniae]NRQ12822.1 hypothetical protein [Ensifer sesbaniae]
MDQQKIPLKVTAGHFVRAIGTFTRSEVGWKAQLMFAGLFTLLCGLSGLNVVNNYVGRTFMTAIADRQTSEFIRQTVFYIGVFAALTVVSVTARFIEERLALPLVEPRFLDRVETTLGSEEFPKVLHLLSKRSIAWIHHGEVSGARELFHAILEYGDDGRWTWSLNRTRFRPGQLAWQEGSRQRRVNFVPVPATLP